MHLCAATNASDPKAWDVVLTENQQVLDEDGKFVNLMSISLLRIFVCPRRPKNC